MIASILSYPLVTLPYKEAIIALLLILLIVQHLNYYKLKKQISKQQEPSNNYLKEGFESESIEENKVTLSKESQSKTTELQEEKKKLLVIEDHQDIRLYLKILFKNDYLIHLAENGEDGLKKAQEIMPDLIITDIMMPIMDGFECTRLLKENLTTCHIPIIQLTALTNDNDAIKGIELGADDYIVKPFNPEVLKTKVKRLIQNRQDLKDFYSQLFQPIPENTDTVQQNQKIAKEVAEKDAFMSRLLTIIDENISNKEFSVKKLAESLNVSQPTLYRRVKQSTSYSITELIRASRLRKAAEILRHHSHSIPEVASAVGYNDAPTFRKHFIEYYGVTPHSYGSNQDSIEK